MLTARISLEVNVHKAASSAAPSVDNPPPPLTPVPENPRRSWPWVQMLSGAAGLARAVADFVS